MPAPANDAPSASALAPLEQQITKVARAQAKLSVRLDDIADGLAGLTSRLEHLHSASAASGAPNPAQLVDPSPILDALDRLDDARRMLAADRPEIEEGLAALGARLEAWLDSVGVQRVAACGVPVDPASFRVIGVEVRAGAYDGEVTRVVRAAARRGAALIREGEVLIHREAGT